MERSQSSLDERIQLIMTTVAEGDQRPGFLREGTSTTARDLAVRQGELTGASWNFVRQVHGANVCVIDQPSDHVVAADGLVTAATDLPLAMLGADCSLVALASSEGVIGIAHAGWRGLLGGVIEATVEEMHRLGAKNIEAIIGPTIGPECYEFSAADLEPLIDRYGPSVAHSEGGRVYCDLPEGVRLALGVAGVDRVRRWGGCTACATDLYSWRARCEIGRHALVIYRTSSA